MHSSIPVEVLIILLHVHEGFFCSIIGASLPQVRHAMDDQLLDAADQLLLILQRASSHAATAHALTKSHLKQGAAHFMPGMLDEEGKYHPRDASHSTIPSQKACQITDRLWPPPHPLFMPLPTLLWSHDHMNGPACCFRWRPHEALSGKAQSIRSSTEFTI